MRPVLFTVGEYSFCAYPTAMGLALIIGTALALRRAVREGWSLWRSLEGCLFVALGGLAGARLLYVALTWDYYSLHLDKIFKLSFTGFSFYGSLFGGIIAGYLWCRWRKINFWLGSDMVMINFMLGYSIVRIGCFLAGCCYGSVTGVYWAVVFPRVDQLYRHPVQLYASAGAFLIFVLLTKLWPRRPFDGVYLLYMPLFYGMLRFTTEFFREEPVLWAGLTLAQLFSLGLVSLSLIVYLRIKGPLEKQKMRRNKARKR